MSFSISSSNYRRYLLLLLLFSAPLFALVLLNFLFLKNSGELLPVETIVSRQQKDPRFCIYGDALRSLTYPYKMEAYGRRKSEVVVIGSSRMLQLRERFFADSFYNFGSAMTNVNEGMDLIEGILRSPHKPRTVIIGTDFWWFNGSFVPPIPYRPSPKPVAQFEGYFLFKPFQWMRDGKITLADYTQTILGKEDGKRCNIGIAAIKNRTGFGPDGSHYYGLDKMKPALEEGVEVFNEVPDVLGNTGRFAWVPSADPVHRETFFRLVDRLRSHGIEVIVVFPPFPSPIVDAMQIDPKRYSVFGELQEELQKKGVSFLDATDPKSIGSSDCEFIDSVHAGDVAAARMLMALDERRRTAGLTPLGNTAALERLVKENAGRAMAKDPRVTDSPEVDFLHLGCEK